MYIWASKINLIFRLGVIQSYNILYGWYEVGTTIACFVASVMFGVAEFLLGKKVLLVGSRQGSAALYIAQLLILSLALLAVIFLISEAALPLSAVGLVITMITLAVVNSLKR